MADAAAQTALDDPPVPPAPWRKAVRRPWSLGMLPALAILAALGLVAVALGNNASREAQGDSGALFWAGLALIYAPIALRLLSLRASRTERIGLVVLLGLSLFMVKVLYSPLRYPPFDELATWRQTHDLLVTGRPFSSNPIAAGFPGFPGLETITATIVQLTGLSIFHAGVTVIGVARAVLMLALFLFLEKATASPRSAGIGVAIYACNPSFLYFDSQFAHESLALTLGACLLLAAVVWIEPSQLDRRVTVGLATVIVLIGCGLTITHHMTSYAMAAFFLLWVFMVAFARKRVAINTVGAPSTAIAGTRLPRLRPLARSPLFPALLMCTATAIWFAFVGGNDTVDELGGVLTGAVDSVLRLIFGGSGPKTLFQGSSQNNPAIARAFAFASVIPLLALIPVGILRTWRTRIPNALWRALSVVAVLYPVTLGLRLTLSGTETSQRASEFVFVGIAFFAALLIGGLRLPARRTARLALFGGLAATATVVFCGSIIVAELPTTRQPGPFLVGADARSVSAQGLAAAEFSAKHLKPNSRVLADRANGTLLGSYGDLVPVSGQINGVPVARVLFSETFDELDRRVIEEDAIDYLVIDQRMDRELPSLGFYLEPDEPGAFTRTEPLSAAALDKFDSVPGIDRIYTNGPIAIYSTAGLKGR